MRFIRSAATTLTLAGKLAFAGIATLATFTVPALTTPAFAQGQPVDVSPSTASPGQSVTFTITCKSTMADQATLYGTTLGLSARITMIQVPNSAQFSATVTLPTNIRPGVYTPSLDCNDGTNLTASLTVTSSAPAVAHVSPSVASAGNNVNIAVVCGTGTASATLNATALGLSQIPMAPSTSPDQFHTTVALPPGISPGTYSPSITCINQNNQVINNVTTSIVVNAAPPVTPSAPAVAHVSPSVAAAGNNVNIAVVCGTGTASATLNATALGLSQIPMAPSTSPGQFSTTVALPPGISPGTYSPSITCINQNNQVINNVTTSIVVNPPPGPPIPIGPPVTGDGATSTVMGGPFTTVGIALLAAGGLGVGVGAVRKRRRSGTRS